MFVALVSSPRDASAQGGIPVGPEFRVNTYTTNSQFIFSMASDSSGNFVVVWNSNGEDGSNYGVFGQRYASSGTPLGPEFRVNTYTTYAQMLPTVASDASGNFVVVWQSYGQDGLSNGVFGQRYANSGGPLGPEFRINTYTMSSEGNPSIAADASGNFVVAWDSYQDGSGFGVFGQRYSASGVPIGTEFRVNTYTTSNQGIPVVASDSASNFVVIWNSYLQDGSSVAVFGQRYTSSGVPLGPEFRVNTFTTSYQHDPSVAAAAAGGFVVVWTSNAQDGSGRGIFGQRYASGGTPLGSEFRVNTYTTNQQDSPVVASDSTGNFVVVWTSSSQDGSSYGILGQRYASSGATLGPEFGVNTYTTGAQAAASVTADAQGNFVVGWSSFGQDGSGYGVFGQRYSPILPVELMHFRVE
jgi:hypothetical protein